MKDLIFRRYAELGKAWRAGLSNEVFRASVVFLDPDGAVFAIALALPQIREPLVNLVVTAMGSVGAVAEDGSISPTILFFSNLQTCIFIMIYGLIPFLQLPALTLGLNAMVLGVLGAWYAAEGISPLVYLVLLVPHGIFELPALAMALGTRSSGLQANYRPPAQTRRRLFPLGVCGPDEPGVAAGSGSSAADCSPHRGIYHPAPGLFGSLIFL